MRKNSIIVLIFFFQLTNANWITNFHEAQQLSLATNKLMVVDFWAPLCGPCKKMDAESWIDPKVEAVLENFIQVKVDIDNEVELTNKYSIRGIPNILIMDGNGFVIYSFIGFLSATQLKLELTKYQISVEYLSNDLINFNKYESYNTAFRAYQKYLDYSLLVDKSIKGKIIKTGNEYFLFGKRHLDKKAENFNEIKQKIDLLEFYKHAYEFDFLKLNSKLMTINEKEVFENNLNSYFYLKLLAAKGLNLETVKEIEANILKLDGFTYFSKKIDLILSKKDH